jgi:lipoprotein-anchoring transpeptidase ErfK/SrfK
MEAMRGGVHFPIVVLWVGAMMIAGSAGPSVAAVSAPNLTVATVQPQRGEVVGVAQPVVVRFSTPISDRAAAEQGIHIATSRTVTGRFSWVNDTVVQWIPDSFWPAHSQVTVMTGGLPTTFETGPVVLGVADISAHTFTVSIDGQVVRDMPASMGKPTRPTPVGSFTILEKDRSVVMDSRTIGIPLNSPEGYLITAQYAERITWGGVFVHSAPWSVSEQGNENVSHGCINLSPDNAAWYFNTVSVGDPVIVQA